MMQNTKQLHAVCRIEKQTGKPAIFYREEFSPRMPLTVFTMEEGHSGACPEHYRSRTRPATTDESAIIVKYYAKLCMDIDGQTLLIHARLRDKKGV